ncbi:maternal effect embryo arrest 12, partial [Striga asiatica]
GASLEKEESGTRVKGSSRPEVIVGLTEVGNVEKENEKVEGGSSSMQTKRTLSPKGLDISPTLQTIPEIYSEDLVEVVVCASVDSNNIQKKTRGFTRKIRTNKTTQSQIMQVYNPLMSSHLAMSDGSLKRKLMSDLEVVEAGGSSSGKKPKNSNQELAVEVEEAYLKGAHSGCPDAQWAIFLYASTDPWVR